MAKVIRLDESHFLYLLDRPRATQETMHQLATAWREFMPGTTLVVLEADAYVDQTGEAELITVEQLDD